MKKKPDIASLIGAGIGIIAGSLAATLFAALIIWWLGPFIFGDAFPLGYWQSFALVFFVRAMLPATTTEAAKKMFAPKS